MGLYATLLLLGLLVILADLQDRSLFWVAVPVANGAALARLDQGANKYTLWIAVALLLPPLRLLAPAALVVFKLATLLTTAALAWQASRR